MTRKSGKVATRTTSRKSRTSETTRKAKADGNGAKVCPTGVPIPRRFTRKGEDVLAKVKYARRSTRITNPDGSVVFEMDGAEIPADWSQLATDIMISKYFRKAQVPQYAEGADPLNSEPLRDDDGNIKLGPERSARQVVNRLVGCWRYWGEKYGYFRTADDAQAYYDEMAYMLIHQYAAPNSPQWFNTGLAWAYDLKGPSQGHYYMDPDTGKLTESTDAYTHPQPHACQPYDALVSTPVGPVKIGEIVEKNLAGLEVYDGTDNGKGTTRVVAVKDNGEKPVYRMVLKNGIRVEATADHLVYASEERRQEGDWLRVDQLVPGMRMRVSTQTRVTREADDATCDEAALAGWLQGDGFVGQYKEGTNRSLTIEFVTVNDDEYDYVMDRVRRVFEGVHHKVRSVEAQDPSLDIRRIRLYGEVLRPFVEKYELLQDSSELSIPSAVRNAGRNAQAAYLRALFQADGTVRLRSRDSRTADVVLTTVSQPLALGVQAMLLNLGVYSRVQAGVDKREDRRTPYYVSIGYAEARKAFKELVGFVSAEKRAKLESACSDDFPGNGLPPMREETIERIELIGTMQVYDIQTESSQYLSNNVLVHNCFIQAVRDDLVGNGGIMDLWTREARLFKYGSGTGTNFSDLRGEGEPLSGGGQSSGLMSFLRVGDRAAGAIKSGGTTRRAAKMVCLDLDHPDIEQFINWKVNEEAKAKMLIDAGMEADFNGEAYTTVSGQNSNNSVRVPSDFIDAVRQDGDWHLRWRTDRNHISKTLKARELWEQVAGAAWGCADPGVQYDTIINDWHTCPQDGRINASNPCSEYMFLDDTACNLASLNLIKFFDKGKAEFDVEAIKHATRLWTITLEISVLMAQFPSPEIAQKSYDFRTLGLGYANLGTCLMLSGIPYDSPEATAVCGAVSAVMTGESYAASAEMAGGLGPFPRYKENSKDMLRVMRNHRRAAYNAPGSEYEGLRVKPVGINPEYCPDYLLRASREAWDRAVELGNRNGYRNAQTTVIAPTGTIGLLMDCDTTGIEPDFALVKFKKLAGGGYFKIINQSVEPALRNLGYTAEQRKAIVEYVVGTLTLTGAPIINEQTLRAKGFNDADISRVEHALQGALELGFAVNPWTLGDEAMKRLGFSKDQYSEAGFNLLEALGFSDADIDEAGDHICGRQTIEGAPFLKEEHLPVFDCANRCGSHGTRFIHHMGHVRMMAAAQPFISGAISKTINMPNEATVEDIQDSYMRAHDLGLKAVAIYRDGSKHSQVLSTSKKKKKAEPEPAEAKPAQVVPTDARLNRRPLPTQRRGFTYELKIAGQKMYLRTGEYENGEIGEIFLDMSKEGATLRSILNCFAIAISKGLQYGVPLKEFVDTFTFTRFEPQGMVEGHQHIRLATSVIDLVFRTLGHQYLGRTDFLHIKPEQVEGPALLSQQGEQADLGEAGKKEETAPKAQGGGGTADTPVVSGKPAVKHRDALDEQLSEMMGDAPMCDVCGHITVRNGACYKCLNCGNSMGCS
jgi:ribonucleoside-diphosphate reductase alpha chain